MKKPQGPDAYDRAYPTLVKEFIPRAREQIGEFLQKNAGLDATIWCPIPTRAQKPFFMGGESTGVSGRHAHLVICKTGPETPNLVGDIEFVGEGEEGYHRIPNRVLELSTRDQLKAIELVAEITHDEQHRKKLWLPNMTDPEVPSRGIMNKTEHVLIALLYKFFPSKDYSWPS